MPASGNTTESISRAWTSSGRGKAYDRQMASGAALNEVTTQLELAYVKRVYRGGPVLEAGAGTGRTVLPAARALSGPVVALDASAAMLSQLGAKDRPANLHLINAVSLDALPFVEDCFGLVMSFGMVGHYPEWEKVILPLVRVIRPGGILLVNHRNADAIRLHGWPDCQARDKGYFETSTLSSKLGQLGLELASVYPTSLLVNRLIGLWSPRARGRRRRLMHRRFQEWIDDVLSSPGAVPAWVQVELELAKVLPVPASAWSIIVARRPEEESEASPGFDGEHNPDRVWRDLRRALQSDYLEGSRAHPAVGLLLAAIEPLVKLFTDGRSPFEDVMVDFDDYRDGVADAISEIERIDLAVEVGDGFGRVLGVGRRLLQSIRFRAGRMWSDHH